MKIIHPHYYNNPIDLMVNLYEKNSEQPEKGEPYLFISKILLWREFLKKNDKNLNVQVIYDYGASLLAGCGNKKDLASITPFFEEAHFSVADIGTYKSIDYKLIEHSTLAFADGDACIHGLLDFKLTPNKYREFYSTSLNDEVERLMSKLKYAQVTFEAVKEYILTILDLESTHFKNSEIEIPFNKLESAVSNNKIPVWPKTILLSLIKLESQGQFKITSEIIEPIGVIKLNINLVEPDDLTEEDTLEAKTEEFEQNDLKLDQIIEIHDFTEKERLLLESMNDMDEGQNQSLHQIILDVEGEDIDAMEQHHIKKIKERFRKTLQRLNTKISFKVKITKQGENIRWFRV